VSNPIMKMNPWVIFIRLSVAMSVRLKGIPNVFFSADW
jgi:hypothetical protein